MTNRTIHNYMLVIVILHTTIRETCLKDVAIPNSHNLQSSVIEKLQKYTDVKEELIRIWELKMVYIIPLVQYYPQWVLFQKNCTKV